MTFPPAASREWLNSDCGRSYLNVGWEKDFLIAPSSRNSMRHSYGIAASSQTLGVIASLSICLDWSAVFGGKSLSLSLSRSLDSSLNYLQPRNADIIKAMERLQLNEGIIEDLCKLKDRIEVANIAFNEYVLILFAFAKIYRLLMIAWIKIGGCFDKRSEGTK